MAETYSGNVSIAGNSNMLYRGYVSAWIDSETDTTATIGFWYCVDMYWAYWYGVAANCYVDGTWRNSTSGYLSSDPGANWKTVCSNSGYVTVAKGKSGRNVPVQCNAWGETVSGYGSAGGSTSCSVNVWVPAITSYAVKYNANGGSGAPSAQTKWHGETLTLSSTKPTRDCYTFQGWGTTSTDTSVNYAAGANYTANKAITLYAIWKVVAPAAPSGVTVTRNSDTKNTVKWTRGENADITYSSIKIERKTDGGSWSQIASVSGSATSYADTATSADHYYEYRIRAYNTTGYSSYATCSTVLYNTPSAPTKIAAARSGTTTVELTITNAPNTATALEIQRSTDAAAWETVATIEGTTVTEATDNPGGGTFYYRARNTRGSLASAWSPASNAVVTICAPNAPTLVAPASGAVVSKVQETVTFEHRHNPIDGSGQTAAQYRISTDDGATYTYHDIEGESEKLALENTFAVNSKVTYAVRAKGAHDDFGPWSDNRVFYVYQAPSVAFAQPTDGFVIENTPVAIQLQCDDPSGTLVGATLSISDGPKVVYTRNMGTDTECEILATEWLPDDGTVYTLTVDVRSSSTLTATATREVAVSFVLPQPATLTIEPDPETGYVSLIAAVVPDGELEAPVSISVYRTYDGQRLLLGEGLPDGAGLVDMYAPLNEGYAYEAVTFADSGAVNRTTFASRVATDWAFLYFAGGGIARGKWNPDDSWKMEQSVDYVHYIGRRYPVAYMRDNMDETHDVSVTLMDRDEAREFRRMMATHEPVVAKLWEGLVFHAVPQVQGKPHSTVGSYWGEVAVSLTRIDGGVL